MRNLFFLLFASIIFFGCSCSIIENYYSFKNPDVKVNSSSGYLKIYTTKVSQKIKTAEDNSNSVYKPYSLYDKKGNLVKDVSKSYFEPKVVTLQEGNYIVVAELHKNLINSFEVNIEKGTLTEIDSSMIENPYSLR